MGKIKNAGWRALGAVGTGTVKTIEGLQFAGNKTKSAAIKVAHSPKVAATVIANKAAEHKAINAAKDAFRADLVEQGKKLLVLQGAEKAG